MRKIKSNLLRIGNQRIGKPVTSLGHKGANGFLRGPNFYKTMSDNFKLCPTRFSRGRKILQMAKPPYASLVTGLRIGCRARDQGPPSGFRQRSPFEKFATASTISYTQGKPHVATAAHLMGRKERVQSASTLGDFKPGVSNSFQFRGHFRQI